MNPKVLVLCVMAMLALVMAVFVTILLRNFVNVGPNQVLIVSGRRRQLPDGTSVGFRCVRAGATFVFPILERVDRLSLQVLSIEMPKFRARTANGEHVETDCAAQVKISGDDASILAAAEHFLNKSEADMKNLVTPVLEKHLRAVLGNSSFQEIDQAPGRCADQVQAAASEDLGHMGLSVISFTIQNVVAR